MEPLELSGEEEGRAIYKQGEEAKVRLFGNLIKAIKTIEKLAT
jgi:hypothetical protein